MIAAPAIPPGLRGLFDDLRSTPKRLYGLALVRVGAAVAALHFYASNFRDREFLWGDGGVIDPAHFESAGVPTRGLFSLLSHVHSATGIDVALGVAVVVAMAFALVGGRILTLLHCVLLTSFMERNSFMLDGGDNLIRVVLPFLCLTINNARFSLVASRVRARLEAKGERPVVTSVHNAAALVVVAQVLLVYFTASFWKLGGLQWQSGTALYYVAKAEEFAVSPLPDAILNNAVFVTLLTYGTVLIQVAATPLTLARRYTKYVLPALLLMHVMIGVTMGLMGFAITMMAADFVLLGDRDYAKLFARRKVPEVRPVEKPMLRGALAEPAA